MADVAGLVARRVGALFYVVSPNETTFQHAEEVPNYITQVVPFFFVLLIVESVVLFFNGEEVKTKDAVTSVLHGIVYNLITGTFLAFTLLGYEWLYERRFIDLDWSSPITWWVAAIGVDFGFYWFHRAGHEINLAWASHQVHHSSEEYNPSTAFRQSIVRNLFKIGFHQPLALLGVPIPALLVHLQFNHIYQFWIHTQFVDNLGPLEWILNTPSHHRVHHGANKWCLDKNYAGVLIIWDRIFGTFEPERRDEEIVYGLVDQPQSFNVLWLQSFYFRAVIKKARSMTTWGDTMKALFYGPGWFPGTPRLGDPDTFPDIKAPRVKYNPQLPRWQEIYVFGHFIIILILHQAWITKVVTFSWFSALMFMAFMFVSASMIGAMYDGWWWAPLLEAVRCIAYIAYARTNPITGIHFLDISIFLYFAVSAFIWTSQSMVVARSSMKASKLE